MVNDVSERERKQTGTTATMIFNVRQIVSYVSHHITLWPGDPICTSTPPGVSMARSRSRSPPDRHRHHAAHG